MIAQIRTGLWVRNGFAIRGQLLHYRDYMLRELCYDQDLFILQAALVILEPEVVLISILERFGLVGYFQPSSSSSSSETALESKTSPGAHFQTPYDLPHLGQMIEELFYVLITILSEPSSAAHLPLPLIIRREIIHALAMGPCSFSDLATGADNQAAHRSRNLPHSMQCAKDHLRAFDRGLRLPWNQP